MEYRTRNKQDGISNKEQGIMNDELKNLQYFCVHNSLFIIQFF